MYRLTPVTASVAAGPEMNSTLFCAASGATWRATPDAVEPAMTLYPLPIRSFAAGDRLRRVAGVVDLGTSTVRRPTLLVPLVA